MKVGRLLPFLKVFPNKRAADFLEAGFRDGFPIPCVSSAEVLVYRNLSSVLLRPDVVTAKIEQKVSLGCMVGPFVSEPILCL